MSVHAQCQPTGQLQSRFFPGYRCSGSQAGYERGGCQRAHIPANTGVPNYANSYFVAADAYDSQKENLVNHTTDFTRSQPLAR